MLKVFANITQVCLGHYQTSLTSLRFFFAKMLKFHLIYLSGNFVEIHREFRANRSTLCGNCAFPKISTPGNQVKFCYFTPRLSISAKKFHHTFLIWFYIHHYLRRVTEVLVSETAAVLNEKGVSKNFAKVVEKSM